MMRLNKTAVFFSILILTILGITIILSIFIGPILIGFLIAYLLNPFFIYLEKKGVSRSISTISSIILIILITATMVWIILPIIITQIETIITYLPDFKKFLETNFLPKIDLFVRKINNTYIQNIYANGFNGLNLTSISSALLKGIGESTRFLLSSILFVLATPIFMYIFMKHLPKFYDFVFYYVPKKTKPVFLEYFQEVDRKLKSVISGQLLVVLTMCILYPTAFLISGLPVAFGIGVLVGLGRIISGLDTIIAFTLGTIVIIVNGSSYLVIFSSIFAYLCVQGIDNFVITPKIMGKSSGLHPIIVLISITVFGYWFGIYGALLAIPLVTILKVSLDRILSSYLKTSFFNS